ncbi:hypothetical protein JX266_009194 [Neoarthrinium moseri]|nr:hypothetical protein JX266_009194 [Neoarthrinium moseri]
MAPIQQTFSLIPELPSALNGTTGTDSAPRRPSERPMTTKEAKKAYKARTKGPKLTKAEQRRQDLMEQDRIRRELEKERNQARARTARDRKRDKEEREKAEKKKKGLPLVQVRPSQDTIARFIKKPAPKQEEGGYEDLKPTARDSSSMLMRVTERSKMSDQPPASQENDWDVASSPDDGTDRPAKRQRAGPSPLLSPRDEPVPEGISKEPKLIDAVSRPADASPLKQEPAGTQERSRLASLDPDDPVTEDLANQQILSESFSADDGLFDDIDIEAFDVAAAATDQKDTCVKQTLPPPEPPDQGPLAADSIALAGCELENRVPGDEALVENKTVPPDTMVRRPVSSCDSPSSETVTPMVVDAAPILSPTTASSGKSIASSDTQQNPEPNAKPKQRSPTSNTADGAARPPLRDLPLNQDIGHNPRWSDRKPPTRQVPSVSTSKPPFRKPQTALSGANSFRSPKTPMGPPPLPPKFKPHGPATSVHKAGAPKFLPAKSPSVALPVDQGNHLGTPGSKDSMPPSSTQLFLLSNVDDLFPSPSQEAEEIFEKPIVRRGPLQTRPKTAPLPTRFTSRPQLRDRASSHRGGKRDSVTPQSLACNSHPTAKNPHKEPFIKSNSNCGGLSTSQKTLETPAVDYMPFLSTQDLLLSSQDIKELEEGSSSPTKSLSGFQCTSAVAQPISNLTSSNKWKGPLHDHPHSYSRSMDGSWSTKTPCNKGKLGKPRALGTNERILKTHPNSQQSSSLPETPTVPRNRPAQEPCPRVDSSCVALPHQFDDIRDEFPLSNEDIAELISEDFSAPNDQPESMVRESRDKIADRTPVAPRPSPKPFFTSSGTKERVYLAIEKTKTTAWVDDHARRKAQEHLDFLLRQEDEKAERLLVERMLEAEDKAAAQADQSPRQMVEATENQTCGSSNRNTEPSRPSQVQKSKTASQKSRGRSQPQSSFEKMLEMLEKSKKAQLIPSASQESDYGDAAWDDDDFKCL